MKPGRLPRRILGAVLLALGVGAGSAAHAGAVITYGNTSLGVNDSAELNFWGDGPAGFSLYGVYRDGVGDAIAPGCPCEGWGVAATIGTRLEPRWETIEIWGGFSGSATGGTWTGWAGEGGLGGSYTGTWSVDSPGSLADPSFTGTWSFDDGVRGFRFSGSFGDWWIGSFGHTEVLPGGTTGFLYGWYELDADGNLGFTTFNLLHSTYLGEIEVPDRIAGFANQAAGFGGLTGGTFGSTASTATSIISLADYPIQVAHYFGPSMEEDIFQVQVVITNLGDRTVQDVVYRRVMDWDVPPTEFHEFVTHGGVEANLEANGGNVRYASNNGFATSDPRRPAGEIVWINPGDSVNRNFTDLGPTDHGSVFDFAFGDLAPGASRIFNIFYGSAPDEATALARLGRLGVDVWSLGQQSGDPTGGTPATFIFAFGGVGGREPGMTPEDPVLPFVPAPGQFEFPAPQPRRWFDPPYAWGFEYTLTGGDEFLEVAPPPAAFGFGPVSLYIAGVLVDWLDPGEVFDFHANGYTGVTSFVLGDILPALDMADPGFATAFPTFLDFTTAHGSHLSMHALTSNPFVPPAVPEPQTLLLLGLGLLALGIARGRMRGALV